MLKSPELTGDWEQKLGEIERGQRERASFMEDISAMIRALIDEGLSPLLHHDGIGACPLCGADVIEGREAFGCSKWKDGCGYRLPKLYRGMPLTRQLARELLGRGLVLRPLEIEGERRVLCRTKKGEPIDLSPPSREAQQRRKARPRARGAGKRT